MDNTLPIKKTTRFWFCGNSKNSQVELAKFIFFYGNAFDEYQTYELQQITNILEHRNFNGNNKTVLYLHGYMETVNSDSIHVIVNAYIKRGDHNIIVLDWGELANGNYFIDAVQNLKPLGLKIAEIFIETFKLGLLTTDMIHLVGHSLGGHMCGIIGRNIIEKSQNQFKLKRITGLDPAFPSFYPGIGITALNKKDAEIIDVIHTDAWLYGAPISTGTIDFWPNSGRTLKANCSRENLKLLTEINYCGHRRSWKYWAESITENNDTCFLSVKAKNWGHFKKGHVDTSNIIQMGINCLTSGAQNGDYFLQTFNQSPYSRGVRGITYCKLLK